MPTFLCGWGLDNVVGQCCSFPHAVSNVIHCTITLNMRVGCHSINVDIVAHINLHRKWKILLCFNMKKCTVAKFRIKGRSVFVTVYLLQCLQGVSVYFSDVVGFCYSIKVLTDRVDIHQAVVCDLNTLEVREKPANKQKRKRSNSHRVLFQRSCH